jgi:hypothetical protein
VSIKKFFAGAKMNIAADIKIKILPVSALKVSKIDYCYPSKEKASVLEIGNSVLNASGAPFDSFLYLSTVAKEKETETLLLLAFQMKLANQASKDPQVINDDTVNCEFTKINDSVAKDLAQTDFVCIILGFCKGNFDENKLPSKCVVISREEQVDFYGPSYYHRLNNRF